MLAVWITDSIGIHAVFGGFLLGIAMPRGFFARELQRQLEPFAVVFLLPMFFTFSGLNTRLDIVNNPQMLLIIGSRNSRGLPGQRRRVLGGSALEWGGQPHRAGSGHADEFARIDGTDHHQYRSTARRDSAGALFDHGADGDCDHLDGFAGI